MNPGWRKCLVAAVSISLMSVFAWVCAQNLWTKSYEQWTKDDIIKIASASPWAQVVQTSPTTGDRVPLAYVPGVTVRLRSALPIRQALVRLKQLEAKYDKMSEQDRADFDVKMKGLLECPACVDNYIITLGPPVSQRQMKSGIGSLKNISPSLLEKRVYLTNELGERRELAHFVAPKHDEDEATFFFPRLDDKGKPLLTKDNSKLIFVFEAKNLRTGWALDSIPERCEFEVSKLLLNGRVEF
jgi:hypothetical protein